MNIDTPESFFKTIPTDIAENIEFRATLHSELAKDVGFQKLYRAMCLAYPPIAFDSMLWTFNPRKPSGFRNIPFILRPKQIEATIAVKDAIDNEHDLIIDKSRDEGATEVLCKMFLLYWLLVPNTMFLVGSRKQEYVDRTGDHKCLFHKIYDHGALYLPKWILPKHFKNCMHLGNEENGSSIDGEATNENFGAGDRRTAVMVDEHGRIDYNIAQCISENLSDTCNCNIYNSTHFYGIGHPYNKLLKSGKIPIFTLAWEENPEKNKGIYRSPDYNIIEIKDLDYYKEKYPGCFDKVNPMEPFKLSELKNEWLSMGHVPNVMFIADGGEANEGGWRSEWYDKEEKRRTSRRDMAQNVDRSPMGSGDMFFDPIILKRIRTDTIRRPDYVGEIEYGKTGKGKINGIKFVRDGGRKRIKWFGDLFNKRPNQRFNYIVSCDISLGTGASNSVAGIYNVNTGEKVGIFSCPNTTPETFADQVVAICHWVGGKSKKPFLIWENNGGHGINFGKRVLWHGYNFCYINRNLRAKRRKRKNEWGFTTTNKSKEDALVSLRVALAEGLRTSDNHGKLIIHDEETLSEYERYIWYENGSIGLSDCVDESSGARAAHGDRVIADALYVVALSEQPKAVVNQEMASGFHMAYRRKMYQKEQEKRKRNSPFL
jgi:hypothetical protein